MNKKTLITIGIILGLVIIAGGFWYVKEKNNEQRAMRNENNEQEKIEVIENENNKTESNQNKNKNIATEEANSEVKDDKKINGGIYDGWNKYYNAKNNFTINYPDNMDKDDNYENSEVDSITTIVSFDNFSKKRVGYIGEDGDLLILIKQYCVNDNIHFKACYNNKIKYTESKKEKEINFMKKESSVNLSEKDIIYKEWDTNIHGRLFKVQYRKYLKPNYIEGGPIIIKEYATIYKNKIYNISCITPTTKSADNMLKLADKIIESLKFDNIEFL